MVTQIRLSVKLPAKGELDVYNVLNLLSLKMKLE